MKTETRSGTKIQYRRRFAQRLTLFVMSIMLYMGIEHLLPEKLLESNILYGDLIVLPIYVLVGVFYCFSGLLDANLRLKGTLLVLILGLMAPLVVDILGITSGSDTNLVYAPLILAYTIFTCALFATYALILHHKTFKDE